MRNKIRNRISKGKSKVLLVNLPWQEHGKWGVRAGSRWPHIKDKSEDEYLPFPFFLSYATSLLRNNDIEAHLIDSIAHQIPEDELIDNLSREDFDILVAETSTPSFYYDMKLLKKISSLNLPIILCGPHSEIYRSEFLEKNSFIDFVLFGEYEFTLLELMKAISKNIKDLSFIKGLIWRDDKDNVIKNLPRAPFDINLLPWPHRDGIPMDSYRDLPGEMPYPSVQMVASRGCPFSCNFCLWPQVLFGGNNYRARDVRDCINEMEFLVREKKFKSVYFDDDTFNMGKRRILRFCDEIIKRNLNRVPWAIMAKADLMDEELLDVLKKAGLYAVKYGVENASQELVNRCGKCLDLKKAEKMIKYTKSLGMKIHLAFTFGLPGETKETIQRTINYALSLDPDSLQFSILTPFPGTRLFEELDKQGRILTKDWRRYDGRYSCVVKSDGLAPQYLEKAKGYAYSLWVEHKRERRGFFGNIKKFRQYLRKYGISYTLKKTVNYLEFVWIKRPRNLVNDKYSLTLDDYQSTNLIKLLKERIKREGMILFLFKLLNYIKTGRVLHNYLDILGIYNGEYAFVGPLHVQIDLTNNCNNNCIACWCNSPLLEEKALKLDDKKQILPFSVAKKLLDELSEMGTKEVYFSGGGEPFMHPQIIEILEYAKSKNFVCYINTNFTLIDKVKIKKIIELGIDHLILSIWAATPRTYEITHPNKNMDTFKQIADNLKFLNRMKKRIPSITLYNVIFNMNYHELKDMLMLAKETKSEAVEFALIDTIPGKTDKLLLNSSQIIELQRIAKDINYSLDSNGYFDGIFLPRFNSFLRRISSISDLTKATYDRNIIDRIPCYSGWCFSRIMPDGDVNGCLKAHRIPTGNIYQQSFRQIWNGDKQRYFRKRTLVCEKKDPFFMFIGNDPDIKEAGCYKSCDDINRNISMHNRIQLLTFLEHQVLKVAAQITKLKLCRKKISSF